MNKNIFDKATEFSNPQAVPEIDVDATKISRDTVDNRLDALKHQRRDYGRPDLDLTKEELDIRLQEKVQEDLKIIEQAYIDGELDEEAKHFLEHQFGNPQKLHKAFKNKLNEVMGCQPKAIKYINLLTGEVDNDTPYFEEHVTPDTTMMYEYEIEAPWRLENKIPGAPMERINIQVIMPKIKDVKRAIEKVKIGGKYDIERQKELAKLKMGQSIEDTKLDKAKLRTPTQKMKDIFRCTILAPRYDDICGLFEYSLNNGYAVKSSRPSKYLDNDPKNAEAFLKNNKNYRDMKNYWMINETDGLHFSFCEVQYKTKIQYFRADIKTHLFYEKARNLQQKFKSALTEGYKLVLNNKIFKHLLSINNLNSSTFEAYNFSVLQDARNIEDRLKNAGVKSAKDGSYGLVREFIDKNFLVRSAKALTDETFEKSPAWAKEIYQKYNKNIDRKYLVDIRGYSRNKLKER